METLTLNKTKQVVKVTIDYDAQDPRDWDNVTCMYCFHRKYNLGDSFINEKIDASFYSHWSQVETALKSQFDIVCILPVSLYDHGGISMSAGVSYGWDCGQVGFIFITKQQAEREFGFVGKITKPQMLKLQSILESSVKEYNQYLEGNARCLELYNVYTDEHGHTVEDMTDSISGFYFDNEYTVSNAVKESFGLGVGEYELQED